jgi:carbamoyl-phosphate synthase small subunit
LFRPPSWLANGISTYKMFNGHRGINHPVKNLISGKGEITSQNHGFAVNKEELENPDGNYACSFK